MMVARPDVKRAWATRRWRWLLVYVGMLGCALVTVALVLPRGDRITSAPQGPALMDVAGPASRCLGTQLALAQSGVFVDFFVPAQGGGIAREQFGEHVAGGEIDRLAGTGDVRGTCPTHTDVAGSAFVWHAVFARSDGRAADVRGTVEVNGTSLDVTTEAADPVTAAAVHQLDSSTVVTRMFLAVAIIIVATRLVGSLARSVRQPRVVGEIVAGIMLGPSVLGALFPDAATYLFPAQVVSVLQVMAQFGLIFFMFMIGLELDERALRHSGHTAVVVSHVSIVLPFSLGVIASLWLYPIVGSGKFSGFALFMGAAMAITAFPVLARILTDNNLHRTPLGVLAIVCAAVDDVTAWCVLAVVIVVVKSLGATDAIRTIVLAATYTAAMFYVVRPVVRRVFARIDESAALSSRVITVVIVFVLASCWTTEQIGVHAIFGAFVAGVVLPRSPFLAGEINDKLGEFTQLFLLPIFFVVVGLSTRFTLLDRGELWLLAAVVIVIAVVGKWLGSTVAAFTRGRSWSFSMSLGVLMNARGITEIVILTIGRNLNVISPVMFTTMVLMALVTTLMTTPLLLWTYKRPARALSDDDDIEERSAVGASVTPR